MSVSPDNPSGYTPGRARFRRAVDRSFAVPPGTPFTAGARPEHEAPAVTPKDRPEPAISNRSKFMQGELRDIALNRSDLNYPQAVAEANRRADAVVQQALLFVEAASKFIGSHQGFAGLRSLDMSEGVIDVELYGACSSCARSERTIYTNLAKAAASMGMPWFKRLTGSRLQLTNLDEFEASMALGASAPDPSGYVLDRGLVPSELTGL